MIVLSFFTLIAIFVIVQALQLGIGPVFTTKKALRHLEPHLPKNLKKGDVVDLGSGFGFVSLWLARRYPKNRVVGFELSWVPYLFSKALVLFAKNLTFQRKCIYSIDLSDKALIYSYLYPKAMSRLAKQEVQVPWISYCFANPSIKPHNTLVIKGLYHSIIYIYK